ncbi:MAG: homocysteine S-methyltransferase family protein [Acidobacteriia bacterium]|nr:homocysteine S-methyltransferase family protein [Terriglobia bacterium]
MIWRDLVSNGTILTDGAWGTELQKRGLGLGECPDAWNLSHPGDVADVAGRYCDAGSRVILTNTFRANPISLAAHGLAGCAAEINRAGVEISKRAAAVALVFASIGPSGKLLPAGEVTEDELLAAFRAQAEVLAAGGADALLLETFSDLDEALTAFKAARATGLPVIVSFAFDTGKNKDRTMTGVTPERAAKAMTEAGVDAVGANCGVGIEQLVELCRRMRAATHLPLWMKPNAGMPEVVDGAVEYRVTAQQFASSVPLLRDAGASFVGGCCGTNPEFIRAAAAALSRCA